MAKKEPVVDRKILEQYAELKAISKQCTKDMNALAPKVREMLEVNGVDELSADGIGKFGFTIVPVWTFPQEILDLEARLDKMKEESKMTGAATHGPDTDRKDLKFYPPKNEKPE